MLLLKQLCSLGLYWNKKSLMILIYVFFTTKDLSLKQRLKIVHNIPALFDVCFFEDLPLHIKHEVLTKGKILYTKNYYKLLKQIQYVDLEYPRYKQFLEAYHQDMVAAL